MILSLQTTFDLGISFGLRDDIFPELSKPTSNPYRHHEVEPPLARLESGVRNPLGPGLPCNLMEGHPDLVRLWTRRAEETVDREDMDGSVLGFDREDTDYKTRLRKLIQTHGVGACHLRIHAIGTVFLRLDFEPGIPLDLVQGFAKCYEFAGYQPDVAEELLDAALRRAQPGVSPATETIRRVSTRPRPVIRPNEIGILESRLIQSFGRLALCVDREDEEHLAEIKRRMVPPPDGRPDPTYEAIFEEKLVFEYGGDVFFTWGAMVIVPRSLTKPLELIDRILHCIEIGAIYQGTCEAFERLFLAETLRQGGDPGGRGERPKNSRDLNRLRNLALAVVSLTSYHEVSPTGEDQNYFARFEQRAHVQAMHDHIRDRCDLLYDVQVAETQAEEAERAKKLGAALFLLAALTVLSVMWDSYQFLNPGVEVLNNAWQNRLCVLATAVAALLSGVLFFFRSPRAPMILLLGSLTFLLWRHLWQTGSAVAGIPFTDPFWWVGVAGVAVGLGWSLSLVIRNRRGILEMLR